MTTFELIPLENSPAAPRVFPGVESVSTSPSQRVVPLFVPRQQLYYWTRKWQDGEHEALGELSEGQGRTFPDGASAAAWLLDDED